MKHNIYYDFEGFGKKENVDIHEYKDFEVLCLKCGSRSVTLLNRHLQGTNLIILEYVKCNECGSENRRYAPFKDKLLIERCGFKKPESQQNKKSKWKFW